MREFYILNAIEVEDINNDIKNRFNLEVGAEDTIVCPSEDAEELEKYLNENYKGIRLCISEDSNKYLGAEVTWNADPYMIETDEQALEVMRSVQNYGLHETLQSEEPEEFDTMCEKLDLEKYPDHIYRNSELIMCYSKDINY